MNAFNSDLLFSFFYAFSIFYIDATKFDAAEEYEFFIPFANSLFEFTSNGTYFRAVKYQQKTEMTD